MKETVSDEAHEDQWGVDDDDEIEYDIIIIIISSSSISRSLCLDRIVFTSHITSCRLSSNVANRGGYVTLAVQ